MNYFGPKMVE